MHGEEPKGAWRPWVAVIGGGVACFAALRIVVALSRDEGGSAPPAATFAAAGVVVAGISMVAIVLATRHRGLPLRTGLALGAAFACIAVAKFWLAPLGFYQVSADRTINSVLDQEALITLSAAGILALYAAVLRLIFVAFRRRAERAPAKTREPIAVFLLGVALVGAVPIGLGLFVSGAGLYVDFVLASAGAGAVALSLVFAIALVSLAFGSVTDRSNASASTSAMAAVFWVVYMLTLVAAWPLKMVTPK
jgi:hypothetical protein